MTLEDDSADVVALIDGDPLIRVPRAPGLILRNGPGLARRTSHDRALDS